MTNAEFNYTKHSQEKMFSRCISHEDVKTCLNYGTKIHRTGIQFYILRDKDIQQNQLSKKLNGLCVLIDNDIVITTYKNRQAVTNTKKLSKENKRKFY